MTVFFLSVFSFYIPEKHAPNKALFRKIVFGHVASGKKSTSSKKKVNSPVVPAPVAPVVPAPVAPVVPAPVAPVVPAPVAPVVPAPVAPVVPAPVAPVVPAPVAPAPVAPLNPVVAVPAVSNAQRANPLDVTLVHGVISPLPQLTYRSIVDSIVIDFLSGSENSDLHVSGVEYSLVFPEGEDSNRVSPVVQRQRATNHLRDLGNQNRPVVFLSDFQDVNLIPDLSAIYKTNQYVQAAKVVVPVYNQNGDLVNQAFFLVRKA